jgi:hypothetical protein
MGKPQQKHDPSQQERQRPVGHQGPEQSQGQDEGQVHADVDLELLAASLSGPVIDLHGVSANDAPMVPEVVNQAVNGDGNTFHLDQLNSIIGDTEIDRASYNGSSFYDPTAGFSMDARLTGGDFKIDEMQMAGAVGMGAGVVSDADAALTRSAFAQTITMGANIQFNSATLQAFGRDLTDNRDTL